MKVDQEIRGCKPGSSCPKVDGQDEHRENENAEHAKADAERDRDEGRESRVHDSCGVDEL